MEKSNFTGWKDIYSFTLLQTIKNKTFIVSYIILLILAVAMVPIISMVTSKNTNNETLSPIEKVYVINKTTLSNIDYSFMKQEDVFKNTTFEESNEDISILEERVDTSENMSVILTISEEEGLYNLQIKKSKEGDLKDSNVELLGDIFASKFKEYALSTLGITEAQIAMISAEVNGSITETDELGNVINEEDTSITDSEYWFIYGILFAVMMINIMASTQIATSIVTEKSTKVIEYLLVSVRPLAIILGKVLAMLTVVLLQMGSILVFASISMKGFKALTGTETEAILNIIPKDFYQHFNIFYILLCLISIGLGLIFYGTLAGLLGATVSKLEEVNEGLMVFTFTNIIGAYIGIGAASTLMASGSNAFVIFSFVFPISAPFILPGAILLGKVSLLIVGVAILLQTAFALLLAKFVARIYEFLILHNGNKIKITQLFQISKTVSKGAKK